MTNQLALDFNCERPLAFPLTSQEEILKSLRNVKLGDINFEGYVLVANNGERLKVKSNTYQIHHQYSHVRKSIDSK